MEILTTLTAGAIGILAILAFTIFLFGVFFGGLIVLNIIARKVLS